MPSKRQQWLAGPKHEAPFSLGTGAQLERTSMDLHRKVAETDPSRFRDRVRGYVVSVAGTWLTGGRV